VEVQGVPRPRTIGNRDRRGRLPTKEEEGGGGQRKVEGAGDVEAGGKPKEEGKRWPYGGEELKKKDKEGVTGHVIE
jgi:hypothetical protein